MAKKNKQILSAEGYVPSRETTKRQAERQQRQNTAFLTGEYRHQRLNDSSAWHQKRELRDGASAIDPVTTPRQAQAETPQSSAGFAESEARDRHQLQAWGYESSQQVAETPQSNPASEKWLWWVFSVLLSLVLLSSQRKWLFHIFPFDNSGQGQPSVEVSRLSRVSGEEEAESHIATGEQEMNATQLGEGAQQVAAPNGDSQIVVEESYGGNENLLQRFHQLLRIDANEEEQDSGSSSFRNVRLFFVKVEENGQLQIKSVLYKVPFDQTPLSRTLEQLLKGPSPKEINKGLHSMLPPDMQILGIRIVRSNAFIDVSEEFYKIAKLPAVLLAAVKQMVLTVTEYPNIKSLRILVEGQPIFAENLPRSSLNELKEKGVDLNSDLRREDLWQGEIGDFASDS